MISFASVVARMFASATPLALGGVGGLFGEKSGIVNIGLEGTMLFSAFAAVLGSYYTGSAWVGLLWAVICGVLISFIHAFFCITLKVDHSVFGIVVNILGTNITVYLSSAIFGNKGFTSTVEKLPAVTIKAFQNVPFLSEVTSNISIITIFAVFFTVFC